MQKNHPDFKDIETDVKVKFETLFINFKPNVLVKVLKFVEAEEKEEEPPVI